MFDMSWGEVMVIGGVALIVIGPKDLPKALRTVGQMTSKVRRMASEFQSQFNEAMREAELDDVRREVEGLNRQVATATSTAFNPIQTIRDELKGAVHPETAAPLAYDPSFAEPALPATPSLEEHGSNHHEQSATISDPVPQPLHDVPAMDLTGPGLEPEIPLSSGERGELASGLGLGLPEPAVPRMEPREGEKPPVDRTGHPPAGIAP